MTLLGIAPVRPVVAHAQAERVRLVGIIMTQAAGDPEGEARIAAFRQELQQLGWTDHHNIRLHTRWTAGNADNTRKSVAELLALAPDVILATGTSTVAPLIQESRTVPIVFVQVVDPVGAGFADNLARPGANATGFTQFEYSLSGKWLELLKEIAPNLTRAAVLRDPSVGSGASQFAAIQTAASLVGMELIPVGLNEVGEIERAVAEFARRGPGGVIVTVGPKAILHRSLIIRMAAQYQMPAVYPSRFYAVAGGLMSYGPNSIDPYRRAAGYVVRILKGEKPSDLPVQEPTKYELIINAKTAKALGLSVPPTLLARADEVIE
jgi:putative ABC transport system substrate-binding protein